MRFELEQRDSLKFRYEGEPPVVITLQNASDNGQPSLGKLTVVGEAKTPRKIDADTQRVLDNPGAFKQQLESLQQETGLKEYVSRTVNILRWRQGYADDPVNPLSNVIDEFSFDGQQWKKMPPDITISFHWAGQGLLCSRNAPDAAVCAEVSNLVVQEKEEPLGHQMLREAWGLLAVSPRAALVIGFAAGEVGFKQLLERRGQPFPERSAWHQQIKARLARIGRITISGKPVGFPTGLLKKLESAAELRNKVVHHGSAAPTSKEVENALRAVNDLLWILDMFAGFIWAGQYKSPWGRFE